MSAGVRRDPWGVPHVRAASVEELAHRQGLATAHDRAWQLEVERLRGEGRLSGLVGPGGRAWDALAADLRIEGTARRAFAALDAETQAFVAAYVDGVRTAFDAGASAVELDRLGTDPSRTPGRWEPWTPLAVFLVQHVLFATFPHHLWRASVTGLDADLARLLGPGDPPHGSNAFAVGGGRTASGRPLVAGDPHRVLEAPGIYHQVGLATPDLDVVGLAFPGVPGVQHFGHTGAVAWAVTNAMADHQSVTVDQGRLVVRTPSTELGDVGFGALLPLLRSRSVADVDAALDHWVEPVNNVLVADRQGRVLHRVAGRVPRRVDDRLDWSQWAELPRREVGARDVAVSANDRTDERWSVLGRHFAAPWRRDRIADRLDELDRLDVASAAAVLVDDLNPAAQPLLDRVAGLLTAGVLDARQHRLADRLLAWDRRMDVESTGAAAWAAVRDELVDGVCRHPALRAARDARAPVHAEVLAPWWHLPGRVAAVLPRLLSEPTLGIDVDALVADALAAVAARPTGDGLTGEGPTWGGSHRLAPVHAFAEAGLATEGLLPTATGSALAGDLDCVAATTAVPGTAECWRGPVVRLVWDLDDRDRSRWAVPLGASGEPGSPHHDDQHAAWRDGTLLPVGAFTLRPVDPPADAPLLHGWVTAARAAFWGMTERTLEEVEEIYGWIAEQDHLTARLVLLDGVPVGLVQTYDPFVDEIGEHYDRRPGDLGVHLFLADAPERAGATPALLDFLMAEAFADPAVRRLVLEPDVDNGPSVSLARRIGGRLGPVTRLPDKSAQLVFVERP